jgi:hypothetical protein
MRLLRNRRSVPLAGGRSHRKYEVNALAMGANNGNSMRTLVFGLRAIRMPACQSRSSIRKPNTSAAPRPYVARSSSIAKSRLPGGSVRRMTWRMRLTSCHGRVRAGLSEMRNLGAITPLARSVCSRPVVCRNRRNTRNELHISMTLAFERCSAAFWINLSMSIKATLSIVRRRHRRYRYRRNC